MLSFAIEDGLVAKLRRLSQQQSTTLFMTLLAAFDTLLARYSGQDDIVVGTPIANRTQTEIEELIGFFVNTLALQRSAWRSELLRIAGSCAEDDIRRLHAPGATLRATCGNYPARALAELYATIPGFVCVAECTAQRSEAL